MGSGHLAGPTLPVSQRQSQSDGSSTSVRVDWWARIHTMTVNPTTANIFANEEALSFAFNLREQIRSLGEADRF